MIQILARTLTGKIIPVEVEDHPSSTTKDIKAKIQEEEGIPPELQRLIFKGMEFDDRYSLSDYYCIQNGVNLDLRVGTRKLVVEEWPWGEAPASQKVNSITLEVEPSLTIGQLKAMIEEVEGMPPGDRCLKFGYPAKELEDGRSLLDYEDQLRKYPRHSIILCQRGEIEIFVKGLRGEMIPFHVKPSEETTETLRVKLELKLGIPGGMQRLIFAGRQLEEWQTLLDYNIQHGSTIHLVLRLRG